MCCCRRIFKLLHSFGSVFRLPPHLQGIHPTTTSSQTSATTTLIIWSAELNIKCNINNCKSLNIKVKIILRSFLKVGEAGRESRKTEAEMTSAPTQPTRPVRLLPNSTSLSQEWQQFYKFLYPCRTAKGCKGYFYGWDKTLRRRTKPKMVMKAMISSLPSERQGFLKPWDFLKSPSPSHSGCSNPIISGTKLEKKTESENTTRCELEAIRPYTSPHYSPGVCPQHETGYQTKLPPDAPGTTPVHLLRFQEYEDTSITPPEWWRGAGWIFTLYL